MKLGSLTLCTKKLISGLDIDYILKISNKNMKKIMTFLFVFVFAFVFLTPVKAFDLNLGNTVEDRDYVDSYYNFSIIDTNLSAGYQGIVTEIQYWARNNNAFKFLIVDELGKVMWKSDLITPVATGLQTYTPSTSPVVHPGWNIGMYFTLTGTIPFDYDDGADPAFYEANNAGEPVLGETLTNAGTTKRYYSVYANGWQFKGDTDGDGVNDINDLCPESTNADEKWSSEKEWGTNRWQVQEYEGKLVWYQNKPIKGGKGNLATLSSHDIAYTYGCNGHQILDKLTEGLGENAMSGHYKFGLSSSVLEEFHTNFADGNISGKYFIETVTVTPSGTAAYTPIPVYSVYPLVSGVNYTLEASGTYRFAKWGEYGIADAAWNYRSAAYAPRGVAGWYQQSSTRLQVWVGGSAVTWQPAEYNPEHKYSFNTIGGGSPLMFTISDDQYGDNSGNITVDIYAQI